MQFLKNQLPVVVTFVAAVTIVLNFYVDIPGLETVSNELVRWNVVLAAFALILGIGNIIKLHLKKIVRHEPDVFYSYVTLGTLAVFIIVGVVDTTEGSTYQWLWDSILLPLESTMYATTMFFITSAAYRAFRVKNAYAAVLMVSAILMMLRVGIFASFMPFTPDVAAWIWDIPNTAGMRAVVVGTALSLAGNAFRIITGLERGHLGGGT
mgnify:CR=1 FL=1